MTPIQSLWPLLLFLLCCSLTKVFGGDKRYLVVDVLLNSTKLMIWINEIAQYESKVSVVPGTHVISLHESHGAVLASRFMPTSKPVEAQVLRRFLESIPSNRILVVVITAGGSLYLSPAEAALQSRGCKGVSLLAAGESLICIVNGGKSWEALRTRVLLQEGKKSTYEHIVMKYPDERAIAISASYPTRNERRCPWHRRSDLSAQQIFCQTYEGFPELCRCQRPLVPSLVLAQAEPMEVRETIPCIIITSKHPHHFYRLLLQLVSMKGVRQTPLVIWLEGDVPAIEDLAKLFGIPVSKQATLPKKGIASLAMENLIADVTHRAIHHAFGRFPEAQKIILLEDDLLLSPDFLWYFQQTSALLDEDPTILGITAYHCQSYPGRGLDPTRVLRGVAPPQWGWLATRKMLKQWMPTNWGDWDYWVMAWERGDGLDLIFPEVSRSLHAGSGGTHIDGWTQAMIFNRNAATLDGKINITNLQEIPRDKFASQLRRELTTAVPVALSSALSCRPGKFFPQQQQGPFIMFIQDFRERLALMKCIRGFVSDEREDFENVNQVKISGKKLFLVSCPASPHCDLKPQFYIAVTRDDNLLEAIMALNVFRFGREIRTPFKVRRMALDFEEEVELRNIELGFATSSLNIESFYEGHALVLPMIREKPEPIVDRDTTGFTSDELGQRTNSTGASVKDLTSDFSYQIGSRGDSSYWNGSRGDSSYQNGSKGDSSYRNGSRGDASDNKPLGVSSHIMGSSDTRNSDSRSNISKIEDIRKNGYFEENSTEITNSQVPSLDTLTRLEATETHFKIKYSYLETNFMTSPLNSSLLPNKTNTLLGNETHMTREKNRGGNFTKSTSTKWQQRLRIPVSPSLNKKASEVYYIVCSINPCVASDPLLMVRQLQKRFRFLAALAWKEKLINYDVSEEITAADYFKSHYSINWKPFRNKYKT